MPNDTPTPRTDAAAHGYTDWSGYEAVFFELCRQLERELADAKAKLEKFKSLERPPDRVLEEEPPLGEIIPWIRWHRLKFHSTLRQAKDAYDARKEQ